MAEIVASVTARTSAGVEVIASLYAGQTAKVTATATPIIEIAATVPPSTEHLSMDKHCELLTGEGRDKTTAMYGGFKLYVQLFTAIVAASVAGRLQYKGQISATFVFLSDALAVLAAIVCGFIIIDAFRSWWGYRSKLSEVAGTRFDAKLGKHVPYIGPANFLLSCRTVGLMLAVILVTVGLFVIANPLQTHHPLVPTWMKDYLRPFFAP